jgi:sugar lactone lactonase YvrE
MKKLDPRSGAVVSLVTPPLAFALALLGAGPAGHAAPAPLPAADPPPPPRVTVLLGNLTAAEGGPAAPAPSPLKEPFGVDLDVEGRLWIIELAGGRVLRLDRAQKLDVVAGALGTSGYSGDGGLTGAALFNGMHNVAVHPKGAVFVSDTWNHCVRRIDPRSGTIETFAGTGKAGFGGDGGPAQAALFDFVMCVTLDAPRKRLLVADTNNRRIRAVEIQDDLSAGTVVTIAGNGQKGVPADGAIARESPLVDPRAVAADSRGQVYVLERGGHALRVIDRDGRILTLAGNGRPGDRDGIGPEAQLNSPKHLCVDPQDRVFIADEGNHAIRLFEPHAGTLRRVLGGGAGDAKLRLQRPHGVAVRDGVLYVADSGNDRVLKVEGLNPGK